MAQAITLLGFMGSGKTSCGIALAERLDWDFADLDDAIREAEGRAPAEIFATDGEARFRELERVHLADLLLPQTVVALGGGTVVDDRNWEMIRDRSRTIWLDVPVPTLWDRVGGDEARPLARDRGRFELLHTARRARYAEADERVYAGRALEQVVDALVALCGG